MSESRILVVEDEKPVASLITRFLLTQGFDTAVAETGADAVRQLATNSPDAIVLDLMLPDIDGLDLIDEIRKTCDAPIIALTARGDWEDRVIGLERGADDYMAKPFRSEELVARIKSVLRRAATGVGVMRLGELSIDLRTRAVTLAGRRIFLSSTEFSLLELLAENVGRPVSREQILHRVWADRDRDTNLVEVYINYLRKKLEQQSSPRLIFTVRGRGYILKNSVAGAQ